MELRPIARVHTDFGSKFGVPRQNGLVPELTAVLEFEPEFRSPEAVRGLESYSHIWLIWQFSENAGRGCSPTVRPPRLGGNRRVGVFASRSPFRPNPLGLSCVRLLELRQDRARGPLLLLGEAEQQLGIHTDMVVDEEPAFGSGRGETVVGGEGYEDLISHTVHIQQHDRRRFLRQFAGQEGDHITASSSRRGACLRT